MLLSREALLQLLIVWVKIVSLDVMVCDKSNVAGQSKSGLDKFKWKASSKLFKKEVDSLDEL